MNWDLIGVLYEYDDLRRRDRLFGVFVDVYGDRVEARIMDSMSINCGNDDLTRNTRFEPGCYWDQIAQFLLMM